LPFDDRQLAAYVVGSAPLAASLRVDPALRDLARTPLFLAILRYCFLHLGVTDELASNLERTTGEIRESIFDLYVRLRIEHELARQPARGSFSEERLYNSLGDVTLEEAWFDPVTANFENSDISKALEDALGSEAASTLLELCVALQILVRDNQGAVRFTHQLLRRHFGRRACLRVWNQRILWDWSYTYDSAVRSALNAMSKLAWFGDEREVESLIKAALQSKSKPRAFALMALGGIGNPAASGTLCALLADMTRFDREAACCDIACWALIQIGQGALPALRELRETTTSTHLLPLILLVLSRINCEDSRVLVESLVRQPHLVL
jgi:hypothetical protein